jgi:uncharacterized protein involved in tolerance to divalent cations
MVLVHILTKNEKKANEIVDYLLSKKMIMDAILLEKVKVRKKSKVGLIQNESQIMIMAKTKALLFTSIDKLLRNKYQEEMPVIYSVPIVHMDWEQADELMQETAKV